MNTTFLLHGGRLRNKDVRNDLYFRELTKILSDGDNLLHIPFARTPDKQQEVFEKEKEWILEQTDKKITVVMAKHENLIQQISSSKAIHITGGDCPKLVKEMQGYPDFVASLKGKVVGGSSAGACLFATYYWTGDTMSVHEGLGVLPVALLVHYGSEEFHATDAQLELLKPYAVGLELLALEEAEWVIRGV
ncbi:MAG TPA: Type 1 glutamine amidotransferase-like domain-containing protein [Candidatus Saccharimonadaceae bacterium]|nr:Type 1 glutamine amidotransferase-like domain-containing protein [Candidatus Saccharimonadaceae bacterium]